MSTHEEIKYEIDHATEGPVTEYVAICRALNLAAVTNYSNTQIADALLEVLQWIRNNGDIHA